jgi:hypothetical protein
MAGGVGVDLTTDWFEIDVKVMVRRAGGSSAENRGRLLFLGRSGRWLV